jgi:alpha-N-acetylglucosaminidase
VVDPKAAAAWEILRRTAYDLPDDNEWSEAASGLYAATPSLTAASASSWAPRTQRYDMALFATALPTLLEAAPATQQSATYRYDLMDLSRQVMSNLSRQLLPQLRNAYESGKCREFVNLSNLWLANIELTDRIAGTDPQQLLGRWLKSTRDFARTDADRIALERDQRSIISLWTPGLTDLNDYANREWNGLLGGYYAARWSSYFDSLTIQLTGHGKGGAPDWDAMGRAFVAGTASYEPAGGYATRPAGDVVALARTVVERAALVNSSKAATTPVPGPAAEQRTARSGCGPK